MSIEQPSLQQHCISIFNEQGVSVSKQALDKRFTDSSVSFVQKLFELYLASQVLSQEFPSAFNKHFSAIRIMDSTEFKLPECMSEDFPGFDGDGTKSCTQIQFEYDLLSGRIKDLSIGDARICDSAYVRPHLCKINPSELIIRDLGYSKIESFKEIEDRGAYYISRLNPNIHIYEQSKRGLIPLRYKTIVQRLKKATGKYLDMTIYLGRQSKHPVRLIANLLSAEAVNRRLKKKIYQKNQNHERYKFLSQMNLFITNVPKKILTANQVYNLYKVRWQIELVFKTWKSILKINKVRKMKSNRFKCYLLSKLLWILVSWEICQLFHEEIRRATNHLLSIYKCFSIVKLQASHLKAILFSKKNRLREWFQNLFYIISEFGLKENKKGRINLTKLLKLKDA